jgi:hypothetical protein
MPTSMRLSKWFQELSFALDFKATPNGEAFYLHVREMMGTTAAILSIRCRFEVASGMGSLLPSLNVHSTKMAALRRPPC